MSEKVKAAIAARQAAKAPKPAPKKKAEPVPEITGPDEAA